MRDLSIEPRVPRTQSRNSNDLLGNLGHPGCRNYIDSILQTNDLRTVKYELLKDLLDELESNKRLTSQALSMFRDGVEEVSSFDEILPTIGLHVIATGAPEVATKFSSVITQTEELWDSYSQPRPSTGITLATPLDAEDKKRDSEAHKSSNHRGNVEKDTTKETLRSDFLSNRRRKSLDSARREIVNDSQLHVLSEQISKLNMDNALLKKQLMDAEANIKIMTVRSARDAARLARQGLDRPRRKSVDSPSALQNQLMFDENRKKLIQREKSLKLFQAEVIDRRGSVDGDDSKFSIGERASGVAITSPANVSLIRSRPILTADTSSSLSSSFPSDSYISEQDNILAGANTNKELEINKLKAELKVLNTENRRLQEEIERLQPILFVHN